MTETGQPIEATLATLDKLESQVRVLNGWCLNRLLGALKWTYCRAY